MQSPFETIEHMGYTIELHQDEDTIDPREDYDHLGHMVCWHRCYNLGDEQPIQSPEAWLIDLAADYNPSDREIEDEEAAWKILEKHIVCLPLYLYDHSGITMNTGGFSCPWDSGQVGWIYVTRKEMLKEWSRKKWSKKLWGKAVDLLESEVKTYDDYLTGNVYGYVILDPDGEDVDSCWGFYGDPNKYMVQECKSIIEHMAKDREKEIAESHIVEVDEAA
jgi:hypothetical protein